MNPRIPHHKVVQCNGSMRLNYTWESEVSITVVCLLCSPHQELFEKHVYNQSSHYEKYDGAMCSSYRLKLKYLLSFSVSYTVKLKVWIPYKITSEIARYTAVQIKKCLKSTSEIKVATMKNMNDFSLHKGSHHVQLPN